MVVACPRSSYHWSGPLCANRQTAKGKRARKRINNNGLSLKWISNRCAREGRVSIGLKTSGFGGGPGAAFAWGRGHFAMQPRFGQTLFAADRSHRDIQGLRRLLPAEAAEESQLDDLGFSLVDGRERVQSIVESFDLAISAGGKSHYFLDRQICVTAAALD